MSYVNDTYSYQILNPKGIKGIEDPKKCTKILIESTELAEDQYRLGNTKARNIFSLYTQKIYFEQKQMQMQNTLVNGSKTDVQTHTLTHTYLHTHTHSQYEKRCRTRIEGSKPRVALLVCVCFHILLLSLSILYFFTHELVQVHKIPKQGQTYTATLSKQKAKPSKRRSLHYLTHSPLNPILIDWYYYNYSNYNL